jgi:hypothetical protein
VAFLDNLFLTLSLAHTLLQIGVGVMGTTLKDVEVRLGEVADETDHSLAGRDGFQNAVCEGQGTRYLAIALPEYLRPPKRGIVYA